MCGNKQRVNQLALSLPSSRALVLANVTVVAAPLGVNDGHLRHNFLFPMRDARLNLPNLVFESVEREFLSRRVPHVALTDFTVLVLDVVHVGVKKDKRARELVSHDTRHPHCLFAGVVNAHLEQSVLFPHTLSDGDFLTDAPLILPPTPPQMG